jgi:cysteine desulfurase / selenocysteine lyase
MARITAHTRRLTEVALERLLRIPGLTVYGPRDPARRSPLVAFNIRGRDPIAIPRP